MNDRLLFALAYVVPGALVALAALHAGFALSATFRLLLARAAEARREVPSLVTVYFKHTSRVLIAASLLYLAVLSTDAVLSHLSFDRAVTRALGYAGGVILLVCGFALLLHGMADRELKLQPKWWRRAYIGAGVCGIALAAFGMAVVTWYESVWAV